MATVTFLSRIAGAAMMIRFADNKRMQRFLDGLSASVIAALVASQLVSSDNKIIFAIVVAITIMGITKSVIWAMLTGMIAAAAYPFLIGL